LHRRHRIEEAGRQPPEAAIAQAGVGFALKNVVEIDAESGEHFAT
jgi:hypothetical protein